MPQGGKLQLRGGPADDERFSIEVIDTGAGMEPHVVDRIFEPFFTTKQSRGAGLGMSITYGIMSRLGGKIEVESAPGRGTTFRLWFAPPKERRADAEDPSREGRDALIEPSLKAPAASLDLLVVDDEARVRTLFVDVLREEGHTVAEADCARAAMEQIKIRHFDAVITDLGMPDLTGWDVARFVKERSPETYVVLTSGWGDDFSEEYLAGKCVDHWLPKPVSLDELYSVVGSIQPIIPRTPRQLAEEA